MSIVLRNMAQVKIPPDKKLDILSRYAYTGKDDAEVINYIYKDGIAYLPPNIHKLTVVSSILNEDIVDERSEGEAIAEPFTLKPEFQFRKHQTEPAKQILDYIRKFNYGVLQAPCSSGKTVILAHTAGQLQRKTLIVVDLDIHDQWEYAFKITYGKKVQQITKDTQAFWDVGFATLQLLYKNPDLLQRIQNVYGTLLVDEMHAIGQAETYKYVIYRLNNKNRIGTTATYMNKNFPIEILSDTISSVSVTAIETDAMIPDVYFVRTGCTWCSGDPYEMNKINSDLADNYHRNELIINRMRKRVKEGRKILFIANSQKQIDYLYDVLLEEHIGRPVKYTSKTPKNKSKLIPKQFEAGEYNILLTCKKVEKAVDLPTADCLVVSRLYNNEAVVQQLRGRVERSHKDKLTPVLDVLVDTLEPVLSNVWVKPYPAKTLAEVFAWKHRRWHVQRGCKIIEEDNFERMD